MEKNEILNKIKGGLIVSCQALKGEPLYLGEDKTIMPLMAKAAVIAGASGIRTNGELDIVEIKKTVDLPVIGIIKHQYDGYPQYITVGMREIDKVVKAGADIVALDCTMRERYDGLSINEFITAIKNKYKDIILMADISTYEEGVNAYNLGVDLVGTTLNGYTPYTEEDSFPNYELVKKLVDANIPVIAEGKIHYPEQAKKMMEIGAYAVVVGGAITRPLEIASRFIKEIKK